MLLKTIFYPFIDTQHNIPTQHRNCTGKKNNMKCLCDEYECLLHLIYGCYIRRSMYTVK